MAVGNYTDSMGNQTEAGIGAYLGVPVIDGSVGGELITEIVDRLELGNTNGRNIIRGGHNTDLKLGKVSHIVSEHNRGHTASIDAVSLQLGMNSQAALSTGVEADQIRGYRNSVNSQLASAWGNRYYPVHDRMLTEALKLPNLTTTDRSDIDAELLPKRWRAPFGNDGHYSDAGRQVYIDLVGPYLVSIGWPAGSTAPPPPPPPQSPPTG